MVESGKAEWNTTNRWLGGKRGEKKTRKRKQMQTVSGVEIARERADVKIEV